MTRREIRAKVASYIAANPNHSYKDIGRKVNCATSTIATIAREYGIVRQRGALTENDLETLNSGSIPDAIEDVTLRKVDEATRCSNG